VVFQEKEKIVTAAGVSSGIDMALALAARLTDQLTAEAIQLVLEYDPEPPFHTGSPARASQAVKECALQIMQQAPARRGPPPPPHPRFP
jgi:transcriptional regulator GlxA family with amidase domain